jgi:ankyrin repeat protein
MTIQTAIDSGDVEELNRALASFPGSANELIRWGPGGKNVTHPLHYVSDKVFEKAISERVALRLVDALLKAGSDVNHKQNETALHAAASLGTEDIGLRLIDAGAHPDVLGSFGETPLHWAAHQGQARLVARLLAAGAKTDIEDTRYRATPLGWARHGLTNSLAGSRSGYADVIALLGRPGA